MCRDTNHSSSSSAVFVSASGVSSFFVALAFLLDLLVEPAGRPRFLVGGLEAGFSLVEAASSALSSSWSVEVVSFKTTLPPTRLNFSDASTILLNRRWLW